jgi:peptidoglycan/xylan/chitin deacetylase (PgdA/CDA1 family)
MRFPVLLYHRLFDKDVSREKYEISKSAFEEHLKYLSINGYQTLTFPDLYRKSREELTLGDKNVFITFDDGSYSDYDIAYPVLKKYGFRATFFITVNWVATKNFVNWTQLREMTDGGMSIQSHCMSHSFLSDLAPDQLDYELKESKEVIEKNLDVPVDIVSIPGGFFSDKVLKAAKKVGYDGACTSVPGLNCLREKLSDFRIFNRFVITRATSFNNFEATIKQDSIYIARNLAIYYFKNIMTKVFGSKGYYAVWSKFFRKI